MCYGSGCSNECYDGECMCITNEADELIKTKFPNMCTFFGNIHSIMDYYLTKEEHEEMEKQWNSSDYDSIATTEYYEDLACGRWKEDKDRLELLRRVVKL